MFKNVKLGYLTTDKNCWVLAPGEKCHKSVTALLSQILVFILCLDHCLDQQG